jgi:glyoxylase-like metal-dependent hydrolase (beta-lactamase superfamily II)
MRVVTFLLALLALQALPASGAEKSGQDPVARAVKALGGEQALRKVKSITIDGQARYWEPEQSVVPGGEARLLGDSGFILSRDFRAGAARIDWVRYMVYPAKREFRFTEIIAGDIGCLQGIDSMYRTKQNLENDPPENAMSGLRVAAALRELKRSSPLLVLEMHDHRKAVSRLPDQEVDGARLPAVRYRTGDTEFTVMFDPGTGLPARIRTTDYDNIHGDSAYDLVLSDWQPAGGVQIARGLLYKLNGMDIGRIRYDDVAVNPNFPIDAFAIPEAIRASAPKAAKGGVPYQWVLRRQNLGVYLDSDRVSFDAASQGLRLVELAPGVQHVEGGSHNSLIVAMQDYLVVFDAPINEWQSRWTIDAAKAKYPGKPIRYLVLTHHHMDHAGGIRSYIAEGAQVVVGQGAGQHIQEAAEAPHQGAGNALPPTLPKANIVEVRDPLVLSDGGRELGIYLVANPHAEGMLIGYVTDVRLGYVTDLWSPGRDKLGDKPTPGQAALVAAVQKYGLKPTRFAGGHGTTGDYSELEALAAKGN